MDKFNHSYVSYQAANVLYNGLTGSGLGKEISLIIGGSVGTMLLFPKELADGFCEQNGFSSGDMLANTIGSALFVSQELLFDKQLVRLKFSFSRSIYADQSNGYLGNTLFENYRKDYNGHTYWLSSRPL